MSLLLVTVRLSSFGVQGGQVSTRKVSISVRGSGMSWLARRARHSSLHANVQPSGRHRHEAQGEITDACTARLLHADSYRHQGIAALQGPCV